MKRFLSFFVFAVLFGDYAMAYDFSAVCSTGQTLYYNITSNVEPYTVAVTRENTEEPYYTYYPGGNLEIPEYVVYNGITYSVVRINNSAFAYCNNLTSVTMPNTITTIGTSVFHQCTGLVTITIPNSVTSIDYDAFYRTGWYNNQPNGILYLDGWCVGYKGNAPTGVLNIMDSTKSIVSGAFRSCSGLTAVIIPSSVKIIDFGAFIGCSGLTTVTIGDSVANIRSLTFSECSSLTSIVIPDMVTNIGAGAFSECSGLTSVTIGNSVTNIGDYAFRDCSGLTSVNYNATNCTTMGSSSSPVFQNCNANAIINIGEGVTTIPDYAFYGLKGDGVLVIPNSVISIGDSAFYDCSGLTSVTISNSAERIGKSTFGRCSGLTSVTIGNSVTNIGDYAFRDCSGLTSVTIGNSVTSIGAAAFSGCSGLAGELLIPNSVTSIGGGAFWGCDGLTSVSIGNSVSSIDEFAFYECTGLTRVNYAGDIAGWCGILFYYDYSNPLYYAHKLYIDNNLVADLIIPETISEIKPDAFIGANCLTSVTLPSSLTGIGREAFYGCDSISAVKVYANTPPAIDYYTFSGTTYSTSTLLVPCVAESSYNNDYCWGQFTDIRSYDTHYYYIDTTVNNYIQFEGHTFYASGVYEFEMESDDEECPHKIILNLTVLNGVDEYAADNICIFPNPANNILNISSNGFISTVEFYSTTGQLVMCKKVNGYEAEFDVEGLVDGVYFLRIYGEGCHLPSAYKIVKE